MNLLPALLKYGIYEEDVKRLEYIDFTKTNMFFIGEPPNKVDVLDAKNRNALKKMMKPF